MLAAVILYIYIYVYRTKHNIRFRKRNATVIKRGKGN